MARYTEAVCRQCRREGQKLFLKGARCYSDKCAFTTRASAPGQHGTGRKKTGEYGLQLREKQKAKRTYGVLEKQFRHYFELAEKMKGVTGENMLALLERRLDNVVYRAGFGASRAQARQIVNHGHILVNGKRVDIPSYIVKQGDVVSIREKSYDVEAFKALREGTTRLVPAWLTLDSANLAVTVATLPKREEIDLNIAEHLIVELYSK
ncbi:MAG: 30S ribosomal protein S4 [Clostridiales bacterium]|nr:30S ribosomal protein S4 [Clostridiales bacterium]